MAVNFSLGQGNQSIIKVLGVGGGGGNAVGNMMLSGIKGVDFYVLNTDAQALNRSIVPNKIHLGQSITQGLGCGANPELGKESALESMDYLKEILGVSTKMVFITAGMGGGTGTGAAPVIAACARELGILTVAIVTLPFEFEGERRRRVAHEGLTHLERAVDSLIVINNQNLLQICPKNIKQKEAYAYADGTLLKGVKGISDIITHEGYVNVDFADVNTVMRNSGTAIMGSASFSGEDRATLAVEEALNSPLLDNVDIRGATGILYNITASEDSLTLEETQIIGKKISQAAGSGDEEPTIIYGNVFDDDAGDTLSLTIIATGFKRASASNARVKVAANTVGTTKPSQAHLELDSIIKHPVNMQEVADQATLAPPPGAVEELLRHYRGSFVRLADPQFVKYLETTPSFQRKNAPATSQYSALRQQSRLSTVNALRGDNYLKLDSPYLFDPVD